MMLIKTASQTQDRPVVVHQRLIVLALKILLALGLAAFFTQSLPAAHAQEVTAEATSTEQENKHADAAERAEQDPEVARRLAEAKRQDQFLEQLLSARFARVEPLNGVEVEVAAGVVTLRGLVEDEAQRDLATQLAESVENTIAVDNRLQLDTALNRRLAPVLADGVDRLKRIIMSIPLLLVAGVIVYLAWLIGYWFTTWARPFRRMRNPFLAELLRHSLRLVLLGAGALVALNLLGATALVSAVLGAAGIAGLALGFAFRDLVENYIAGILLSLRQPFAPNDHVLIDGHEGRVATLTSRATSLITLDGNHLRIPNAQVFKGVILNYTRNPTRLLVFNVQLIGGADLCKVQRATLQALSATPGVMAKPAPGALLQELNANGITLGCSGWVDQRSHDFYKVRSTAIRRVQEVLDQLGVLPEAVRRVELLTQESPADEAVTPTGAGSEEDVDLEAAIDEQLEIERRSLADQNLLRHDAPRE